MHAPPTPFCAVVGPQIPQHNVGGIPPFRVVGPEGDAAEDEHVAADERRGVEHPGRRGDGGEPVAPVFAVLLVRVRGGVYPFHLRVGVRTVTHRR